MEVGATASPPSGAATTWHLTPDFKEFRVLGEPVSEALAGPWTRRRKDGWRGRTRTFNPLIQSQVPCQLGHSPAMRRTL